MSYDIVRLFGQLVILYYKKKPVNQSAARATLLYPLCLSLSEMGRTEDCALWEKNNHRYHTLNRPIKYLYPDIDHTWREFRNSAFCFSTQETTICAENDRKMMTDSSALCAHQEIWRYGSGVWSIYIIQAHNAFLGKNWPFCEKRLGK